jgi:hypothetical protein
MARASKQVRMVRSYPVAIGRVAKAAVRAAVAHHPNSHD